jgi:hypothetical protein
MDLKAKNGVYADRISLNMVETGHSHEIKKEHDDEFEIDRKRDAAVFSK